MATMLQKSATSKFDHKSQSNTRKRRIGHRDTSQARSEVRSTFLFLIVIKERKDEQAIHDSSISFMPAA